MQPARVLETEPPISQVGHRSQSPIDGFRAHAETVINNPKEFNVRRCRIRQGESQREWCPMTKSVASLYRYREVSRASNCRDLEALAVVDNPTLAYREVEKLVEPQLVSDRRFAGFNPARADLGASGRTT